MTGGTGTRAAPPSRGCLILKHKAEDCCSARPVSRAAGEQRGSQRTKKVTGVEVEEVAQESLFMAA